MKGTIKDATDDKGKKDLGKVFDGDQEPDDPLAKRLWKELQAARRREESVKVQGLTPAKPNYERIKALHEHF